jgi:hypothetical protein
MTERISAEPARSAKVRRDGESAWQQITSEGSSVKVWGDGESVSLQLASEDGTVGFLVMTADMAVAAQQQLAEFLGARAGRAALAAAIISSLDLAVACEKSFAAGVAAAVVSVGEAWAEPGFPGGQHRELLGDFLQALPSGVRISDGKFSASAEELGKAIANAAR